MLNNTKGLLLMESIRLLMDAASGSRDDCVLKPRRAYAVSAAAAASAVALMELAVFVHYLLLSGANWR